VEAQHHTAAGDDLLNQGAACNITFACALKEHLLQLVEPGKLRSKPMLARLGREGTYLSAMGGATNCGFPTFEQCMTYVSGNRGFCARNTQYVPPPGPRPRYLAR
jgi:hypothetical protein